MVPHARSCVWGPACARGYCMDECGCVDVVSVDA